MELGTFSRDLLKATERFKSVCNYRRAPEEIRSNSPEGSEVLLGGNQMLDAPPSGDHLPMRQETLGQGTFLEHSANSVSFSKFIGFEEGFLCKWTRVLFPRSP